MHLSEHVGLVPSAKYKACVLVVRCWPRPIGAAAGGPRGPETLRGRVVPVLRPGGAAAADSGGEGGGSDGGDEASSMNTAVGCP